MAALTFDEAAHLLRRMGFGGTPGEINDLIARGREGAVDYLINYGQINNSAMEDVLERSFDFSDPTINQNFNPREIRRWWFTRMILTRRQFEEKMTLFWHNHFATSLSKVPEVLMFIQIDRVLRPSALDRFDTLLLKVAQDPAMLIWLDGITNVRGRPNENFSRELQELFTMGINDVVTGQPNYTEDDVKEISRAFTGWQFRGRNRQQDPFNFEFFINPNQHDNGPKTIYGQTANFSGEDVITILSAKRATARFLVKELFEFFVYPLTSSSADKNTIEKFADVYIAKDHSIRELVRAIFSSDEFFSERAIFGLIKSPVELIVGSYRMLGAQYNPGSSAQRNRQDTQTYIRSALMGMDVFNPPDVNGWDLNLGWVNTTGMLERFNFSNAFISNRTADAPGAFVSIDALRKNTKSSSKKTVKKFLSVLGPLKVSGTTLKELKSYLETNDQGQKAAWTVNDQTIDQKVRGLVHQIMSLPEYQSN
ncbi:MAG TPA: DUF1800 domain-containing protein [Blastocatellia bacterium]|nr:DUF1800 domain-containing protein [Blastocatellia bacterium]